MLGKAIAPQRELGFAIAEGRPPARACKIRNPGFLQIEGIDPSDNPALSQSPPARVVHGVHAWRTRRGIDPEWACRF